MLEILDVILELATAGLESVDLNLHLGFALLGLQSLAHAKGNGAFVERLVALDDHFDLITHFHEQVAALGALDRYLADQLVWVNRSLSLPKHWE